MPSNLFGRQILIGGLTQDKIGCELSNVLACCESVFASCSTIKPMTFDRREQIHQRVI
jgi:hypothetical protein